MSKARYWVIYLIFAAKLLIPAVYGQQGKAAEAMKKKEKVERSHKKDYEKARKKTLKHRREIQTKETRSRMDEADKRAKTYNKEGDPGVFERVFRKKRHKK
jgi:Ni/Co efflux regulator RcnB